MYEFDREKLIEAWIAIHRAGPKSDLFDKEFWAYEALDTLASREPLRAWELILEILAKDQSQVIVEAIGAGVLEQMLCDHGEVLIEFIENESQSNTALRRAMRVVDIWPEDSSVYERFYSIEDVGFPSDNKIG